MNRKSIIVVLAIILAIGGGVGYLLSSSEDEQVNTETTETIVPAETVDVTPQPNATAGTYVDYSSTAIADASGTKLLFFHAPWCPQCRELEADIKANGVPADVTIIKVDYDSEQSLRQKYGVTLQTTIVKVDSDGNLVEKFVAYDDPSVDAIKENLL